MLENNMQINSEIHKRIINEQRKIVYAYYVEGLGHIVIESIMDY